VVAYIEIHSQGIFERRPLEGERLTIGHVASNDIPLPSDRKVSRTHAILERLPSGWAVRDLGSTNGTYVNGKRIWRDVTLKERDEVLVGKTRLVYRRSEPVLDQGTEADTRVPELTRRERDVLIALCRPALSADTFTEPASAKEIATALFVTEAAVKQHLLRLYDKFGIHDEGERRRVQLANKVIRSGSISLADLMGTAR
jgi:pSer/pThr/pTyr-binding forkhead associated (FHA) protein